MRICFELLEMLKAHRGDQEGDCEHFGYIAKAIGPSDVLATLLNNPRSKTGRTGCACRAIAIVGVLRALHCNSWHHERVQGPRRMCRTESSSP